MKTTALLFALILTACGQGPKGDTGDQGLPGTPGTPGTPGQGCSVTAVPANLNAPAGGSLISCPDGSSSLVLNGINGSNGHDGSNGQDGRDGHDGTPGTVVSSVQFCHGTPSYPSTFPEVGFRIGGQLFAVYSANGGFLTLIPPGTYVSNGIGNSCTFTVNSDGSISN